MFFGKRHVGRILEEYRQALAGYIREVTVRAEKGTVTRAEDYVMREFSDPAYVSKYLNDLEKKWRGLFD